MIDLLSMAVTAELRTMRPKICEATKANNLPVIQKIIETSKLDFNKIIYPRITCGYRALDAYAKINSADKTLKYYEKMLGRPLDNWPPQRKP